MEKLKGTDKVRNFEDRNRKENNETIRKKRKK